jgi:endoglucanase
VTFKAAFLSTLISPSTAPGSVANITVSFSQGANLLVNVLQWNTPTLGSTSSKLPATSTDLLIPITWAGISRPAAVRAKKFDDTYVFDDWTRYLGPLQQGRMTYGNHWDWDGSHVILKAAVVDAVRAAGLDTVFTIEFYPRVPGNALNYTLTV